MKTKNLFAVLAVIAIASLGFVSCEKEEDVAPATFKQVIVPVDTTTTDTTIVITDTTSTDTTVVDTVITVIPPHPYEVDATEMYPVEDLSFFSKNRILIMPVLIENNPAVMQVFKLKIENADVEDTLQRRLVVDVYTVDITMMDDTTVVFNQNTQTSEERFHFGLSNSTLLMYEFNNWPNLKNTQTLSISEFEEFLTLNGNLFFESAFLSDLIGVDFVGAPGVNWNTAVPELFKVAKVNNLILPAEATKF
jgi:hypothetical protein